MLRLWLRQPQPQRSAGGGAHEEGQGEGAVECLESQVDLDRFIEDTIGQSTSGPDTNLWRTTVAACVS